MPDSVKYNTPLRVNPVLDLVYSMSVAKIVKVKISKGTPGFTLISSRIYPSHKKKSVRNEYVQIDPWLNAFPDKECRGALYPMVFLLVDK